MSARVYSKLSPLLWGSRRFRGLSSTTVRLTLLYMLTSKHANSAGCYRLPDAYACEDLQLSSKQYIAARRELVKAGMIQFDESTSEVLIDLWFKHNAPMNPDHFKYAARLLELIDSAPLRQVGIEELEAANQKREEANTAAKAAAKSKKDQEKEEKERVAAERNVSNITGFSRLGETHFLNKSAR